ncbi:MAG: AAA family ATPase, partial [Pseudomonadota bacterium]
ATTGVEDAQSAQVLDGPTIIAMQHIVRSMPVGDSIVEAILNLVRAARPDGDDAAEVAKKRLAWGPGPRAAQSLMLAIRARALLDGRLAPSLDDVHALAPAALTHRMALSFAARAEGASINGVIAELLAQQNLAAAA